MIYDLVIPPPPDNAEQEFRVLEWHHAESEAVESGALLVEIETAKSIVEVRAGQAAVLRKIVTAAGTWQRYGEPVARLSDDGGEALEQTTAAASYNAAFTIV